MNVHFIAIGGAIMHNLAIALKNKGFNVTGSDDAIYDPARKNLKDNGLLPKNIAFSADKITNDLDAVILGMHAKFDNPELMAAKKKGIKIFSFPEYVFEQSMNKKRVVIAGSHGKTTITSAIMHVLKYWKCDFDYLVGAPVKGFKNSVKLTNDAPVIILEGDEYLASPIDRIPKFLYYKPTIALISGISWDHVNVFPTYKEYFTQFIQFISTIEDNGTLVYNTEDPAVRKLSLLLKPGINKFPYHTPGYVVENNVTYLTKESKKLPLKVFGEHNLNNLQGARIVCNELGISDSDFYKAIQEFEGPAKRLELLNDNNNTAVFKDFAHSPSKVLATVQAVKNNYKQRELVACLELHTFSSLSKSFLKEYANTMDAAEESYVFYDKEKVAKRGMTNFSENDVREAFQNRRLNVYTQIDELLNNLKKINWENKNLLMMSSGNFNGTNLKELADFIIYNHIKKPAKGEPSQS